jgi:hypothetical protein
MVCHLEDERGRQDLSPDLWIHTTKRDMMREEVTTITHHVSRVTKSADGAASALPWVSV